MDPLDDLDREFQELHRRAGGLLRTMAAGMLFPFAAPGLRPAVDVYETPDALVVILDASGISEADIEVFLEGHHLRVRGRRARPVPSDAIRCHRCEIEAGPFDLQIPLPRVPAAAETQATLALGYLRVVLPMPPGSMSRASAKEEDR